MKKAIREKLFPEEDPIELVAREDALRMLSEQIRKPRIKSAQLLRLLNAYGKLTNWFEGDPLRETKEMKHLS